MCLDVLRHAWYQVTWQKVLQSAEFGSVTRLRWLAMAVRRHDESIQKAEFTMWLSVEQLLPGRKFQDFSCGKVTGPLGKLS